MPDVYGFANVYLLERHFNMHKSLLGVGTKEEYLEMAKRFLEADPDTTPDIVECFMRNGDRARFNRLTNEFAIVSITGIIRTYFIPVPSHSVPPGTLNYKYYTHPHSNNITYFRSNCR